MPEIHRVRNAMLDFATKMEHGSGSQRSFERRGFECAECLPLTPCGGHYLVVTVDGQVVSDWDDEIEYELQDQAMGAIAKALAIMDWERVEDVAALSMYARKAEFGHAGEVLTGFDLWAAVRSDTTFTRPTEIWEQMKGDNPLKYDKFLRLAERADKAGGMGTGVLQAPGRF